MLINSIRLLGLAMAGHCQPLLLADQAAAGCSRLPWMLAAARPVLAMAADSWPLALPAGCCQTLLPQHAALVPHAAVASELHHYCYRHILAAAQR